MKNSLEEKRNDLVSIIEEQVRAKVSELSHWQQVRWQDGRLSFETQKILWEIQSYDTETKILYFETLLKAEFKIYDYRPGDAPDITLEFKNWVSTRISILKIESIKEKENAVLGNGFKCNLTDIQKNLLIKYLKDQKIIDKGTSEKHILALLSEEELPSDFVKIKWILINPKGGVHQQALRDLFEVALGIGNIPSPKKINEYFTDKDGNPIKFSKPHGNSNYFKDFDDVVNPK